MSILLLVDHQQGRHISIYKVFGPTIMGSTLINPHCINHAISEFPFLLEQTKWKGSMLLCGLQDDDGLEALYTILHNHN